MNDKLGLHLVVLLLATPSAVADTFPYRATIRAQTAPVRSGPGTDFYATGELAKGQMVEVYRHKNDRWCAIRPPEGSFSWVLAGAVRATDDPSLLKVTVDGVRTRVGSRLHEAFNVAYVKLREGEILRSQGPPVNLPGTARRAYRVDPPSGEFRWIHRRYLTVDSSATASQPRELSPTSINTQPLAPADEPTGSAVVPASHDGELKLTKLPNGTMETFPIPVSGEPQAPQPAVDVPTSDGLTNTISDLQRQIDRIDLRLTQTITQPVSQWNLRPLRSKLERIVEHASDASAIKQATQLLVRIGEFDRIQQRHQELSGPPGTVLQASHEQATTPTWQTVPGPPPAPEPAAEAEPNFSGQGWLTPVFTKRHDLPHFALTDDDGTILFFVSPSSGLNLRRYLRTRVGIFGSITETTSAETPQLVAQRVVVLDRHQR